MNDKKYSPGTSETEELIDGSFRSAMNYIVSLVKSWKLDPLQRTLAIISAVSSLFLLINLNGQMYIWMCALAGLLQLWMCVKKVKIESFTMAFTYSLFSVGSLITAIQQIINYGGYYFSGWRQLVLYALVTMAWILALKKDENKNTLRIVFFVISCMLGAYEVIYVLLALRTSFKLALYGLAWIGFIAVFAIQVFMLYRKNALQRQTFVQIVNSGINSINPQMPYYSPEQPQTTALQQEQPSAIPEEAQTPSFARETIYCTKRSGMITGHIAFYSDK